MFAPLAASLENGRGTMKISVLAWQHPAPAEMTWYKVLTIKIGGLLLGSPHYFKWSISPMVYKDGLYVKDGIPHYKV